MKKKRGYTIRDFFDEVGMTLLFLIAFLIEIIWGWFMSVLKLPMGAICKAKGDHDWKFYGGGFSPFPGPKYPFVCLRCGCRSKGDFDSLAKKGFKGKAKI
jgi:hypothetical protein